LPIDLGAAEEDPVEASRAQERRAAALDRTEVA
jgi:hypothetical protein